MRAAVLVISSLAVSVLAQGGTNARLYPCDVNSNTQKWQPGPVDNELVQTFGGACLDVEAYGTTDGSVVWAYSPCHPEDKDPTHQNESWDVDATKNRIVEISSGKCLDTLAYSQAPVIINTCSGSVTQTWTWDSTTKLVHSGVAGMCLDVGATISVGPCGTEPASSMPFCNTALPLATRVANLVGNLTLAEKLGLFANGAGSVSRLNIPAYQWWSEALHGVAYSPGVSFGGAVTAATSFPQVITTAASFNASLFNAVGTAIGIEGRAMSNLGQAGNTFWTPNINIIRDPRWGRGQETPGEDPFLTSTYAANFVPGLQGDDNKYLRISSCCKHYWAYDLENWGGVDRHHFNAIVSAQDETETYMPSFQSCVQRGKVSSLMCSYNAVNGVPSCANSNSMTTLARQAWGFQGYITSDCGAVADVLYSHHYTNSTDETCAVTLNAGMDIDCGGFLDQYMGQAITDGALKISAVDTALTNLFSVQFRLGMFDPPSMQPYKNYGAADVNTPAHQELALSAARQGIVLLKNDGTLPLAASKVKTVAVVGPNADATGTMQGNYNGKAPYLISPQAGIATYANTLYSPGCSNVECGSNTGFAEAEAAAKTADATVIVIGIDQSVESEGHDRTAITLPGLQNDFIQAVVAASKGPVTVVVMAGGPLDISVPKSLPGVNAILWCGYPGQSGGQAIADVIFGAYAPAGRLPYTMYPADFVNVSMFDMNMRPNASSGNPGHTYKFYTGTPVYPFGTGLSYTTWRVTQSGPARVDVNTVKDALALEASVPFHEQAPLATISVTVTNTGAVTSDYVALLFQAGSNPVPGGNDPIKSLVGFQRVNLAPGASITIPFPIDATALSRVDVDGKRVATPDVWRFFVQDHEEAAITIATQ